MSAAVKHVVKIGGGTTVGDLRRAFARCPKDARLSITYSEVTAAWTVVAEAGEVR